jgi:hypothetical protein
LSVKVSLHCGYSLNAGQFGVGQVR